MPSTPEQLVAAAVGRRASAVLLIDHAKAQMRSIIDGAKVRGAERLTAAEDREISVFERQLVGAVAERDHADRLLAEARKVDAEEREYVKRAQQSHPNPHIARARADASKEQTAMSSETGRLTLSAGAAAERALETRTSRPVGGAHIGREERTYRPDEDPQGKHFLTDVASAHRGDYAAGNRLGRHMDEEKVERGKYMQRAAGDAGTGAFTGLVVPQYLTDMYAPLARGMRPFADQCAHHDLPAEGMTVNISRITTGTSVALQATELAAVSATSIDDTLLTEQVQTAAGQQLMSRQAIERGTGAEDVTLQDLFRAHATTLDATLLNQATTGLAAVSAPQSYVNATVDTTAIPAVWKQIIQAQNATELVLLGQAPVSHIVMHNRRWNWLCAAISASWPVVAGTNVPPQSWGMQLTNEYGAGVRGVTASGLKIVVDANVSTTCLAQATTGGTQDQVYVVAADECHLWEDPNAPHYIRAEQTAAAQLGVLMVVYSYFAYSFRRYTNGSTVVEGTGLAAPSFV